MSAFGSGHDIRILGSSPTSGSLVDGESASPSAPPPFQAHPLSLSEINEKGKYFKNLIKKLKALCCNSYDPGYYIWISAKKIYKLCLKEKNIYKKPEV